MRRPSNGMSGSRTGCAPVATSSFSQDTVTLSARSLAASEPDGLQESEVYQDGTKLQTAE